MYQVIRSNQWLYIFNSSGRDCNCDEICLKGNAWGILSKVTSSKGKLSSRFGSCSHTPPIVHNKKPSNQYFYKQVILPFWNKQSLLPHSYPFRDVELKQLYLLSGVFSSDMDRKNTSSIIFPACWFLLLCCWSHTRHPAAWNANSPSPRNHMAMCPLMQILVYKITIKYFKFQIRGNGDTAKKVVWESLFLNSVSP